MRKNVEQELIERLAALEEIVDRIDRSIEKIEVATIVRDPSSKLSVDAYDGLRKQIAAAANERVSHLVQLVEFESGVAAGSKEALTRLVDQWMRQAGLIRIDDPTDERFYDVLGGSGPSRRILRYAYVDSATGRPIRMGQVELVQAVAESLPTEGPDAQTSGESPGDEGTERLLVESTELDSEGEK